MKFVMIVGALLVALCAVIVSCGPQKSYCPNGPNGECGNLAVGGNAGSGSGGDPGDATIITGNGGSGP